MIRFSSLLLLIGLTAMQMPVQGNPPEKEVKTTISEVTVFPRGAQVFSQQSIDLPQGETDIRFTGLSPYIVAQSIQVKTSGALTVLSVNLQQNYLDKPESSPELLSLENQLKNLDEKITLEQTHLAVLKEEMAFLNENRQVGGSSQQVSTTHLQQVLEFYSNRLTALKLKEIERNETLHKLRGQRNDLQNQINLLTGTQNNPAGEIVVRVDVRSAGSFPFTLSYLTENAGWYPSYDLRAKNISEPVQLIYKANIKQDTKMDWTNVKLTLSTANPGASGVAPTLLPYYLSDQSRPPSYRLDNLEARGQVISAGRTPLAGVRVSIEGSTIATVTDAQGNFSIALPEQNSQLNFSQIGYVTQILPAAGRPMQVILAENIQRLDEINVRKTDAVVAFESVTPVMVRGTGSLALPTAQVAQQTSVEFLINRPYTVLSDNKNYTVEIENHQLTTRYHYLSIPKVDKDAFLIAELVDWEQYNLLDGEASLFFEDTYVGKTVLNVSNASDTLRLSLGRDRNVVVKREKTRDFNRRQFIGSRQEEARSWKISVRNNKAQTIDMIIRDQVPVSTQSDIEVTVQHVSHGEVNAETGEVHWEFKLDPAQERSFDLQYQVRYPKSKTLIIE